MTATGGNVRAERRIASLVPILGWIRTYDRARFLRPDILAGLTVAAFSVPESMAYAGLAGLSPENGLYASMIALLVYAVFGTSRQMSVGTTSALAIMVAGTLGGLSLADSESTSRPPSSRRLSPAESRLWPACCGSVSWSTSSPNRS